jgi:hypothetical protein
MASKALTSFPAGSRRGSIHPQVEATALFTLRPMTRDELARVAQVLQAGGMTDMKPARVLLSHRDAKTVASGSFDPVQGTLVTTPGADHAASAGPRENLERALTAARARGVALKEELLADPKMLSTAAIAELLGMSEEGVRLKRKRHEILGLEFAKRGIRYPSWQLLPNAQLLPTLPRLFDILGPDPWRLYRFLLQHHPEIGGTRALDALKRGRSDAVLAAAQNSAAGAFA